MSKIARKITGLVPDSPFCDSIERAQTLYFNWLMNQVVMDSYCGRSYFVLAKILHNIEFYWVLDLDENRAKDGVRLRHIWFDAINSEADALGIGRPMFPLDALSGPCSVLEMLVALANRIEADIMQDDRLGNRAPLWFWWMISNLGIGYDDAHLGTCESNRVSISLQTMLDRTYGPDGLGGLFPLKQTMPGLDQAEDVDIWWQAQYWLAENYPNEEG